MITVFYDGKCNLCSTEINHYRKIAPKGIFIWQDITQNQLKLENEGIRLSDALKFLHAKNTDGKMHIGVDAFILIWKQLKHWQVLARAISFPLIRPAANLGYKIFASWRFKRLKHCQLAAKDQKFS